MLRVENTCELGGVRHSVTARADWGAAELEVTVAGTEDTATHRVASFEAHEAEGDVSADQRTQSGHCVAFVHSDDDWFKMNDDKVIRLSEPPDHFPCLVLPTRVDTPTGRLLRGKQARADPRTMLDLLTSKVAEA
eukprot:6776506-Pyramimonas_sp.AAC.1